MITNNYLKRSKYLRKCQTSEEAKVWEWVRAKKMLGLKFRRQYVLKPYILDFCCVSKKICIEIDGSHHGNIDQFNYDQNRKQFLEQKGIHTIRLWNDEIQKNSSYTYDWLMNRLEELCPL